MIPLLPRWVVNSKNPAFYDTESATAIEMVAKLYGSMNALIDDYNKFVDNTNKIITEFNESVSNDIELFKVSMRQEFQDFIDTVEMKIMAQDKAIADKFAEQDSKIDAAIDYMKINLRQTLISILNEMRDSGELSEEIRKVVEEIVQELFADALTNGTLTEVLEELLGGLSTEKDWSVNDENDPRYIKGRTHYSEDKIIEWDGIVNETNIVVEDGATIFVHMSDAVLDVEELKKCDLETYTSTPAGIQTNLINIGEKWDENAELIEVTDDYIGVVSITVAKHDETVVGDVTLPKAGIYFMQTSNEVFTMYPSRFWFPPLIKQLDEKFIPIIEDVKTIVFPSTTQTTSDMHGDGSFWIFGYEGDSLGLNVGKTYIVNWDGTDYECVADGEVDENGGGAIYLGDASVAEHGPVTSGEPFFIMVQQSGFDGYTQTIFTALSDTESTEHTVEIKTWEKKIKPSYIPDTIARVSDSFKLPEGGEAGQVLVSDGNGGAMWATIEPASASLFETTAI